MGESGASLFRRGMISAKAAQKYGVPGILSKTSVNRPDEGLDSPGTPGGSGRKGLRDQGGIRDRGPKETGRSHFDKRQTMGSPAAAGGSPSKRGKHSGKAVTKVGRGTTDSGGSVNAIMQPTRRAAIDAPALQRGSDVTGGRMGNQANAVNAKFRGSPSLQPAKNPGFGPAPTRAKGKIPPMGGQYGGGGRETQ
jgi:hypothetical protein